MRPVAADVAGVGLHRTRLQAAAGEDPHIGLVHGLVAGVGRVEADVEAVGVLHDEFLGAHQPEARPDLVAELGLYLVEGAGELAVGVDLARGEVGHHLLVRGAQNHRALGAVTEPEHARAHRAEASRLLPQFGGLERGHEDLERPGPVHLLADDALDLAQGAQAQRQEGVEPAAQAADQAGAQHQLVAGDLGFLGFLAQRVD